MPNAAPRYRVLAGHLVSNRSLAQLHQALDRLVGCTVDVWVLGPPEEADVVLLPRGVPMPPVVPPVRMVWVDGPERAAVPGGGLGGSLSEPFEAPALLAVLRDVERKQPARRRQGGAPSWHRPRMPVDPVPQAAPAPAQAPAPAPTPSVLIVPGGAEVAAPAAESAPPWRAGSHLYRLRRWPAPGSLVRHRYLPRLASLLMSRSLSLSGLAALSNVGEAECEQFLAEMDRQGLLSCVTDEREAAPAAVAAADEATTTSAGAITPAETGWMARLRARWSTAD